MQYKRQNPVTAIADIRAIAAKVNAPDIAAELIDDINTGTVEAFGFGYFGEQGTIVIQENHETLWVHAVYSHDIGVDEAAAVAEDIARNRGLKYLVCVTNRPGLAAKLCKRRWSARLSKKL
jgi:hypothetical protein